MNPINYHKVSYTTNHDNDYICKNTCLIKKKSHAGLTTGLVKIIQHGIWISKQAKINNQ